LGIFIVQKPAKALQRVNVMNALLLPFASFEQNSKEEETKKWRLYSVSSSGS
jgi:hypothetical protein